MIVTMICRKNGKRFAERFTTKSDDFKKILKTIEVFLDMPFMAAVQKSDFSMEWSASTNTWN